MTPQHRHPVWSVFKNATSQTLGRLTLSLMRFAIAVLIVRWAGPERFGEYSIVLTVALLMEWAADFGHSDVAVREISRDPPREGSLLAAVALLKAIHAVVAGALVVALLAALGYPGEVIRAGAVAAVGVLAYGAALVCRTLFRARLTMERDVGSELAGVLVMIPLTWWACVKGWGLEVLVGCHSVSRLIHAALAWWMARKLAGPIVRGALSRDVRWILRAAIPIGIAGLLVSVYNAVDTLMVSKLDGARSAGVYSSAQRFVFPVIIVVDAIASSVFPLLASYWRRHDDRFRVTLQRSFDLTLVLTGGALCAFQTSAGLLMGLMGPEMREDAALMRVMALALVARAVTSILSPLVIVTGRAAWGLWLTGLGLCVKTTLLALLIPSQGLMGVGYAWLATDLLAGVIPAVIITQRMTGVRLSWRVGLRVAAACAGVIAVVWGAGGLESPAGLLAVIVLYPLLLTLAGAVRADDLRQLAGGVRARFQPGEDPLQR